MLWIVVRAALIVAAGVLLGSWLEGLGRGVLGRGGLDPTVREALGRLVRPVVIGLAVLVAIGSLGLDVMGAVVVAAALLIAAAIAGREAIADATAGAILLTRRPFRAGDAVALGAFEGVVVDLALSSTTLRTADGSVVTLPNRRVLDSGVALLGRGGTRRVAVSLAVAPGADFAALSAAALRRVGADARFAADPAPVLLAERVDARALTATLAAWARADDATARSALLLALRDAAAEASVDLAAP